MQAQLFAHNFILNIMKTFLHTTQAVLTLFLSIVFFLMPLMSIAQSAVKTYSEGITTLPTVSTNDLLQTTATISASSGKFDNEVTTGTSVFTDGLIAHNQESRAGVSDGSSITYTFTSYAIGYTITAIDIYSSWGNHGRLRPNVQVFYSLVATPNVFVSLTTANFNPTVVKV